MTAVHFDISVVIPAYHADVHLPALLRRIEAQTLRPREAIVVSSSPSEMVSALLADWRGTVAVKHSAVEFAYPGGARNIGVQLARAEWIAFIDCRTLPTTDWLERSARKACELEAQFVGGLATCAADTAFKQVVRALTYGNETWRTLPGSLVRRDVLDRFGGFASHVRAGEDLEWLHRVRGSGVKCVDVDAPTVVYDGFPESLGQAVRKWFVYALASADIEVRNDHKSLYLALFLMFVLFIAYNWNAAFAHWDETSSLYIPNITKTTVIIGLLAYLLYRGLIRPLGVKVEPAFLLPVRWLMVGLVGLCLDLAKAPGLLWGSVLMLARRLTASHRRWQSVR